MKGWDIKPYNKLILQNLFDYNKFYKYFMLTSLLFYFSCINPYHSEINITMIQITDIECTVLIATSKSVKDLFNTAESALHTQP